MQYCIQDGKNNEYLYSYQLFELGTKDTLAILL